MTNPPSERKYDFETLLNRYGVGSIKWNEMLKYGISEERNIIPMSNAEMEFFNPPELVQGLKDYLDSTVLSYFQPTQSYYDSVIDWMQLKFGWSIEKEWIMPFPGIHGALSVILSMTTSPGDGVIVLEPFWPGIVHVLEDNERMMSSSLLLLREDALRYEIDYEDLEKRAANPKNKLLFFCSPHNPVGRVWTRAELERVGEICLKHGVTVVSDEVHADLTMPGYSHIPFASLSEELSNITITCTAPSKSFNLAGMAASNVIASNSEHRKMFNREKTKIGVFRPSILSMKCVELAYSKCGEWLGRCVAVIDENRRYVAEFLAGNIPQIRATPLEGSYLMWLDMRSLRLSNEQLENGLMRDANVFFDDGYYFGAVGSGFERVNIACPKEAVADAMNRLERWVKSLEK